MNACNEEFFPPVTGESFQQKLRFLDMLYANVSLGRSIEFDF